MQKNIVSVSYYRDEATKRLVAYLESNAVSIAATGATLYYEFPLFKELDEEVQFSSLMMVSPHHGILIFQCDNRSSREIRMNELAKLDEDLSQIYTYVHSKLINNKKLRKSRNKLLLNIQSIIYLPNFEDLNSITLDNFENHLVESESEIQTILEQAYEQNEIDSSILQEVFATIEGSKGMLKPKHREVLPDYRNKKIGIIATLEKEIASFDEKQKYAALSQLDGPQRIRGLAGSGKTVVLAMKAALIHLRNPEAMILYTFYTKSLYDHIRRLITRFYRQHVDKDPNWEKVHIRHAWGGAQLPGVYYDACQVNQTDPMNYTTAVESGSRDPFDFVCKDLLKKNKGELQKVYDFVFMDEAQDFKPSFYHLCRSIVKNDCLVWAYDELQNILNVKIQSTITLFEDEYGHRGIDLAALQEQHPDIENDIVLPKCYRNPKEILVVAHAIGFGIYNDRIIQMLENNDHWHDVGYEILKGNSREGDHMKICRSSQNSPLSISTMQEPKEIIKCYVAESMVEEVNWVCESIKDDIQEGRLYPEDILVICADDKYARKYFTRISWKLTEMEINSNNLLSNTFSDEFFSDGCVTLSTVYRAKGNEAPVVYVIGTDTFAFNKDSRTTRNKMFTAFTRAKAWLRVTGSGEYAEVLVGEIQEAMRKLPCLEFIQPNLDELEVFQRDLSEESAKKAALRAELEELRNKAEQLGLNFEDLIPRNGKK